MGARSTRARIDGIIAAEAPVAVVFRRGPSKVTQMLVWDLDTDVVTAGQWLKGHVYTRRCDLSPDARYLVGAYTNYRGNRLDPAARFPDIPPAMMVGWTAVSRPPYFSALALWFSGGAWNGGGQWVDPRHLLLNSAGHWIEAMPGEPRIRVTPRNIGLSEDEPLWSERLERSGWQTVQDLRLHAVNARQAKAARDDLLAKGPLCFGEGDALTDSERLAGWLNLKQAWLPRWVMDQPGLKTKTAGAVVLRYHSWYEAVDYDSYHERWELADNSGRVHRQWDEDRKAQWLDLDHRGRVIFGDKGCLWAWEGFPNGQPTLIADLNANTFEPVPPPPWALEW